MKQPEESRALLEEVRDICGSLGATPTLTRASRLESSLAPSVNPKGLTVREAEILRLIATGRSDQQIADALFLSPRTVERHIANIYLKIHAHSRAEASAYAHKHHLR